MDFLFVASDEAQPGAKSDVPRVLRSTALCYVWPPCSKVACAKLFSINSCRTLAFFFSVSCPVLSFSLNHCRSLVRQLEDTL